MGLWVAKDYREIVEVVLSGNSCNHSPCHFFRKCVIHFVSAAYERSSGPANRDDILSVTNFRLALDEASLRLTLDFPEKASAFPSSERPIDRQWACAKAWLIRCVVKFLGGNPVDSAYEQNEHELFIRSGKDDIL